jgi:uncharacterized protein YdaU (DUF1376 family)
MGIQKPEWFKVDAAKFLSDAQVDAMSTVELGACFRLLCRQWIDGTIPDNLHLLARLCRLDADAMGEAWVTLETFFPAVGPEKRANRFMWIEREKVIADLERKSDEGTRWARKRWEDAKKARDTEPIALPNGSPIADPMQDQTRADQSRDTASPSAPSRSKSSKRTKRESGTRISENFVVTDEHRSFARRAHLPTPELYVDEFLDYWRAQPGNKGLKLDWNATFRTWLRRSVEFATSNGHGRDSSAADNGCKPRPRPLSEIRMEQVREGVSDAH